MSPIKKTQTDNEKTNEVDPFANMSEEEIDNFEQFFDAGEAFTVRLWRTEPEKFNDHLTKGYLGELSPTATMETVREKYGGGLYIIKQLKNNRWTRIQRKFRIAGDPIVFVSPSTTGEPAIPNLSGAAPREDVFYKDINLGANMKEFESMITRMQIVKSMLPDPNETLLKIALSRTNDGGASIDSQMSSLLKMLELTEKLRPAASGGDLTSWSGIAEKGLSVLDKLIQGRQAAIMAQQNRPALTAPVKQPIAESSPGAENVPVSREADNMFGSYVEKSCQYIVQGYIQEPQQTAPEVAAALATVLPIDGHVYKDAINAQRGQFLTIGDSMLNTLVEPLGDPEAAAQEKEIFHLFFNNVLDIFTSEKVKS